MESFEASHPAIRVELEELNLADLRTRLQGGLLDIAIAPRTTMRRSTLGRLFYEDALIFLPRGRATGGETVTLPEVSSQKFLMVPDVCGLATTTRALFSSRRLPFSAARQRALGYHVLEQWSEAGMGAAILPASKVVGGTARGRALVDERNRPLSLAIDASWLARGAQTPAACAFVAHLRRATA